MKEIEIELNINDLEGIKKAIQAVYSVDVNYQNMNYANIEMSPELDRDKKIILDKKINNFDSWIEMIVNEIIEYEQNYISFFDDIKYDGIENKNKKELTIIFI